MTVHQNASPENLGSPVSPRIAANPHPAATEAGSASDSKIVSTAGHTGPSAITGQPAPPKVAQGQIPSVMPVAAKSPAPPFPQSWYRPRFLVLPTGRTILAWGVFDTKDGKPLPTGIPKTSDFVIRCRTLGKAMAFARRLNEKHEQKVAA